MKALSIFLILIIILSSKSYGETKNNLSSNTKEIEFTSDTIKVDEKNKIVTATGNVVIINENRKTNNLSGFITVYCSEFKNRLLVNKKFDLIVANLFLNILKKLCLQFSFRLKEGGYLIVSEILKMQLVELKNFYIKFNFKVIKIIMKKTGSLLFLKNV